MILRLAISSIIVLALAWGAASQTSAQDEPASLSTMASIGGSITPTDLLQLTLNSSSARWTLTASMLHCDLKGQS